MELELRTSNGALPGQAGAQPEADKEKPSAVAAGSEKPTGSPGGSAKTAGSGSPAEPKDGEPKPEKPGRAAAAAAKERRKAEAAAQQADVKKADADKVAASVEKYRTAVESGDPDQILAALGWTDEQLVDKYIAKHQPKDGATGEDGSNKELADLKKEFAEFKAKLAEKETKAEERRQQEEQKAQVQQHVDSIKTFAAKPEHGERFEVCNAGPAVIRQLTSGEYEDVGLLAFDVMIQVHGKTGEFLSYEQALDRVESALLEAHKAHAATAGKLKKLGGAPAAKSESAGTKKAEEKPAAGGGDGSALERLAAAFKAKRPVVTNALSVSHPATQSRGGGKAAADQRFRERVLALQTAAKAN